MQKLAAPSLGEQLPPVIPQDVAAPEISAAVAEGLGIAGRIAEKLNALTDLPYDLIARWKSRAPDQLQAVLENAGALGKLASSLGEHFSDLMEQIGPQNVKMLYRIGSAAVKAVLITRGYAVSPSAVDAPAVFADADSQPSTHHAAFDVASNLADTRKTEFDLGSLDDVRETIRPGAANPAEPYEVHLPEWKKTGEGSIWFELNSEKGVANYMGYDELTKDQKQELTEFVLDKNNLTWEEAKNISHFTMPSHQELEAKLQELGATYNADADDRPKQPPAVDPAPPKPPVDEKPPVVDTPEKPEATPTPTPSPTESKAALEPAPPTPPAPENTPTPSPTLSLAPEAITPAGTEHHSGKNSGLTGGQLLLGSIAASTIILTSAGHVAHLLRNARRHEELEDGDEIKNLSEMFDRSKSDTSEVLSAAREYLRRSGYPENDADALQDWAVIDSARFHRKHGKWPTPDELRNGLGL